METLYQRVGGFDVLDQVIAQFYQNVLTDRDINMFFIQNMSDIARLHSTMVQYLSLLMGGPDSYKGPNMKELHKNMKIKKQHFDLTWKHMSSAFKQKNVSDKLIEEIKEVVYSQFCDIVNTV